MLKKLLVITIAMSLSSNFAQAGDFKLGEGGGPVGGSAGTESSKGSHAKLEKCDRPIGVMAVAEPQDFATKLGKYSLPSATGLIRLMIQQSNCFMVVERGVAMQNLMQERDLAQRGMARGGSNMGGGQMVTADYVMTPDVVFSESNAGGAGGALAGFGNLFGAGGAILGAVAAGVKFKQAQTSMLVADARSGLQVAAASGSAEKADWGVGGLLGGAGGLGAFGAYENTAEGKVIAASFLDNYNKVVQSIRDNPSLRRTNATLSQEAGTVAQAGAVYASGDVVTPKINGVKVYASASTKAKVTHSMKRDEEAIVDEEQNGMLKVEGSGFEGWVETRMVRKP